MEEGEVNSCHSFCCPTEVEATWWADPPSREF